LNYITSLSFFANAEERNTKKEKGASFLEESNILD